MFCELQLFSTHLLSHNKNKGEKCRAISLMNNTFFWYWPNLRQTSFQNAVLKFLLNSGTFSEQLLSSFWGYLVHTSCPLLFIKEQNVPSIIWTPKHFVFLRQLKVLEWYQKGEETSETSGTIPLMLYSLLYQRGFHWAGWLSSVVAEDWLFSNFY